MKHRNQTISYSGIDGSGKTSVIEGVKRSLEDQGVPVRYVWLRYNHYLTKFLLAFCRIIGLTHYHTVDGDRIGYHDFHRSKVISYLFIFFTYIDTLAVTILLVYIPRLFTHTTVICDRWVLDILIDLEIDTQIPLQNTFISKMFYALVPDDAKCFKIYREYEPVLHARSEHKNDKNFKNRYELYYSVKHPRFIEIRNTTALDDVVKQAVNMVVS